MDIYTTLIKIVITILSIKKLWTYDDIFEGIFTKDTFYLNRSNFV